MERVLEPVDITTTILIDIPGIEMVAAELTLVTDDTNEDGTPDGLVVYDPDARQTIRIRDLDLDGEPDVLETTRQVVGDDGTTVTQVALVSETALRTRARCSFTALSRDNGRSILSFSSQPEGTALGGVSLGETVGEVLSAVAATTPRILAIDGDSVLIDIPKTMASHIDQVTFSGRPSITVVEPDPRVLWMSDTLEPQADVYDPAVKDGEEDSTKVFRFHVLSNTDLTSSDLAVHVANTEDT